MATLHNSLNNSEHYCLTVNSGEFEKIQESQKEYRVSFVTLEVTDVYENTGYHEFDDEAIFEIIHDAELKLYGTVEYFPDYNKSPNRATFKLTQQLEDL